MAEKREEEQKRRRSVMPRSNTVFGQDDGGGVGESFRELEDERRTAEKDFNPVFFKGLFRYFFLCASFFLLFC